MQTLTDGRWRGPQPVPVPEGMETVTRQEAAGIFGVDQRVVTRYAQRGALVKYVTGPDEFGRPGAVVFDAAEVRRLAEVKRAGTAQAPAPSVPQPRRW